MSRESQDGGVDMKQDRSIPARETLRGMLRSAGMRSTAPRVAVLEQLFTASGPLSHAELAALLLEEGFDRATLYRNLIDLTDAGLVTRADRGDHVWRFELRRDAGRHETEHPHFVCTDCGTVACLPGLEVPVQVPERAGVIGRVSEIVIRGQCHACL